MPSSLACKTAKEGMTYDFKSGTEPSDHTHTHTHTHIHTHTHTHIHTQTNKGNNAITDTFMRKYEKMCLYKEKYAHTLHACIRSVHKLFIYTTSLILKGYSGLWGLSMITKTMS